MSKWPCGFSPTIASQILPIQTLQDAKHNVLRLKELLPVESSDALVIAKAQEINAILLSLNGDFADIVTYPPKRHKGIVALRLHNHTEILPHVMARLVAYANLQPDTEHYRGKLFLIEAGRIRIRQ